VWRATPSTSGSLGVASPSVGVTCRPLRTDDRSFERDLGCDLSLNPDATYTISIPAARTRTAGADVISP